MNGVLGDWVLILGIAVVLISLLEVGEWRRLRRISRRPCTGREWRRRFPGASKEEIREFLGVFADAFGFSRRKRLQFSPDDRMMDVYRFLYPFRGLPDGLEIETFAMSLGEKYGFELGEMTDPDVTLGDLFRMTGAHSPVRSTHD